MAEGDAWVKSVVKFLNLLSVYLRGQALAPLSLAAVSVFLTPRLASEGRKSRGPFGVAGVKARGRGVDLGHEFQDNSRDEIAILAPAWRPVSLQTTRCGVSQYCRDYFRSSELLCLHGAPCELVRVETFQFFRIWAAQWLERVRIETFLVVVVKGGED